MTDAFTNVIVAPIVAAIIAALGYVAKLLLDSLAAYRETRRLRRARLVELHSLLRAAWASFTIQRRNARRLLISAGRRNPSSLGQRPGLERRLVHAYEHFDPSEEELRQVIRGITMYALRPTNEATLAWIRNDSYFRTHLGRTDRYAKLAEKLAQLEPHLLLWQAKYDAWMPDPKHNMIYMDDEEQHGLGFPHGIDTVVGELLGVPRASHEKSKEDDDLEEELKSLTRLAREGIAEAT